jgi:hypothetical protein
MKTKTFFASLFGGGKTGEPMRPVKPASVTITAYSQSDVLQKRMKEEKLTHGETVTANLSPVRLEFNYGEVVMYFCPMKTIQVLETVNAGDGGSIPGDAKVEGLNIANNNKSGFYKLKNVILTSNGTIQVKATEKTTWEEVRF